MPRRTLPQQVSDAMETVEAHTGINVPKATAGTTVEAYRQAAIAAATVLPWTLGVVGPVPTISQAQEPVKRPDEHLPSQSQKANTIFEGGFLLSASTSGNGFAIVKDGKRLYYSIDRKVPKKP